MGNGLERENLSYCGCCEEYTPSSACVECHDYVEFCTVCGRMKEMLQEGIEYEELMYELHDT